MSDHHPQGPSSIKSFIKCRKFIKNEGSWNEMQGEGSMGHRLWETGERPPGYDDLNRLVDKLDATFQTVLSDFEALYGIEEHEKEIRLDYPGLNFGTMDRLVLGKNAALIYDGKFGNWSVDDAKDNDQGHNYGIYVFHHYPQVQTLWIGFGNPRREEYTLAKFSRRVFPVWLSHLSRVVKEAQDDNFQEYNYDPVNCSFCSRIACPARIDLARTLVAATTGRVLGTITIHPKDLSTEDLTTLKTLSNSIKTFIGQVDKEAKRRVLEDGEEMEGYGIKEKVSRRVIYGYEEIDEAIVLASSICGTMLPAQDSVELSFSSLESLIVDFVGKKSEAKPLINKVRAELEAAGLLTTESYHYLAANND